MANNFRTAVRVEEIKFVCRLEETKAGGENALLSQRMGPKMHFP